MKIMVVIRHVLILLDHTTVTVNVAFSLSILVNVKVEIHNIIHRVLKSKRTCVLHWSQI